MTLQRNTKVRLVRCPKCSGVLPETVEVPVYRCGGCGAILQAKNGKKEATSCDNRLAPCQKSDLESKMVPGQNNDLGSCSEDGQDNSVNRDINRANGAYLTEKSSEGISKELQVYSSEDHWNENISDQVPSSTDLSCRESEESFSKATAHVMSNKEEPPLNQSSEEKYRHCDIKRPGGTSVMHSSSAEHNHHFSVSSLETETSIEMEEGKYSLELRTRRDGKENKNNLVPENFNISEEILSTLEFNCPLIEAPSIMAETERENEGLECSMVPVASIIVVESPVAESSSPENISMENNEQLAQCKKNTVRGLDLVSSSDTLENLSPGIGNLSSDHSVTLREMSVSLSATTKGYHACDGMDKHDSGGHANLSKRNFNGTKSCGVKGLNGRDGFMVNSTVKSGSQMHQLKMKSSPITMGKSHHVHERSTRRLDEFIEPTGNGYGHPIRRQTALEKDERLSRPPFYSMAAQEGLGHDSPIHRHHKFQRRSSFRAHEKYPEPEKMELLRIVDGLQNQLSRTHVSKQKQNGRFFPSVPAGKLMQTDLYRNHIPHDGDMYADLCCPRYAGGCSQEQNWTQPRKIPRPAFSCEPMYGQYEMDCTCFRCPTELHPYITCCSKERHMPYTAYSCHMPHHIHFSRPQYYPASKISTSSLDTNAGDQWGEDFETKRLYSREKHCSRKRHVRPKAGGAPLISCYHCSQLLQLPADFLLFNRSSHKLRCNACSKVLKFSLKNKTHVVPSVPPPSEAGDVSYDGILRRSAVTCGAHDCGRAEPVSCSDDFGKSFRRSCSPDGHDFSQAPIRDVERNSHYGKMLSNSSFEPVEERNKHASEESRGKLENPLENLKSKGSSSKTFKVAKLSSEIQEVRRKSGSQLHRLLGYTSPSQVIYRW